MTNKQAQEILPTFEFYIEKTKTFAVSCKSWPSKNYEGKQIWNWNVYAYIFENHPIYQNNEAILSLPLHCGHTYDQHIVSRHFSQYSDNESKEKKVVGSDYAHIYDDYDNHPSPYDEIPFYVKRDALELVEALNATQDSRRGND